ncbi:MAG TPA: DUF4276 family protein [Thermoleophilia bacterium]|nr:DUF4276 family protein [Thermoleophilia bacterium]
MTGLRIYVEGGGDAKRQKATLRLGFQAFLRPLRGVAREHRLTWDVILCGGRQAAYDDYLTALRKHADKVNILLVDAEGPVVQPAWQHLQARDGWADPGVGDDCCHLMVQMVEAWLIADPDALEAYYGHRFHRGSLPTSPDVEAIPKDRLLSALELASRDTQKGKYRKIAHCADLLARVSVRNVRQRAMHCARFFDTVERMIDGRP